MEDGLAQTEEFVIRSLGDAVSLVTLISFKQMYQFFQILTLKFILRNFYLSLP
jgi:vacuolar-type H+-ATPase subunit C/Vma6